jgi:hypothetical protein
VSRRGVGSSTFQVPERGAGPVGLLSPCHPAHGLRALIDADDRLVLLCGRCLSPFLALRDWAPEPEPAGCAEGRRP